MNSLSSLPAQVLGVAWLYVGAISGEARNIGGASSSLEAPEDELRQEIFNVGPTPT